MRYPCRVSATQSRFSDSDVASACALQFDPPDRTVLIRPLISGYPPTASPEAVAAKRRDRMERLANGIVAAIRGCFHCSETTGSSRRGTAGGCYVPRFPTSAWLFFFCISFRFGFTPPTTDCNHSGNFYRRVIRNEMALPAETKCPPETRGETAGGVAPEFARYRW